MAILTFEDGAVNRPSTHLQASIPEFDPTLMVDFFDDFHTYTASDWLVTESNAAATQAIASGVTGANGALLLVNNTAGSGADIQQLQHGATAVVNESFLMHPNSAIILQARFKIEDADQNNLFIGLSITDTTAIAGATDRIGFHSAAGALTFKVCKNSLESSVSMATLADDTWINVAAVKAKNSSSFKLYVNDALVGSLDDLTNLCDDELLAVTFGHNTLDAGGDDFHLDYVRVAMTRLN